MRAARGFTPPPGFRPRAEAFVVRRLVRSSMLGPLLRAVAEQAAACGQAPLECTESLDPISTGAPDQRDVPGATEPLTGNRGYVEPEAEEWGFPVKAGCYDDDCRTSVCQDARRCYPDVVLDADGRPVCTCTLTHRCAACRDGLVDGYGAWRRT